MEDQQSAAGDLTGSGVDHDAQAGATGDRGHRMPVGKKRRASTPSALTESEPPDPDRAAGPADTADPADTAGEKGSPADDSEAPAVVAGPPLAGRGAPAILGAAAALFIGAGAFAGAAVQPYLADRAVVDTKLDIARTAADAITTLWTYTPENMESLADRSARFLAGDFEAQYRKYVDAIAPTNKQAQVSNSTRVVGAAVETLNGADATVIVYTNSTATSPLTKDIPSLRYLSYRLTVQRHDSTWLVTSMNTITSLDLTPQI